MSTSGANLDERSKIDFLIYANSVIKSRAIPSVEDNLKPIHRRILWSMYEKKIFSDKKTVKSAKVVGDVMGAYHPHGDAAIYGALVRMSQWWKLRYPLIEFQGNGGNILGDGPAAARYTECKLSPVGMLMLEGLNQDCVDFRPNYDNTLEEPCSLPSKFPYLLCGNNSGIAVGMSSDLVSHNFTEVANAIKYYIGHKDCTIADLMQYIKGPDFPTGGQITNGDELLDIYSCGRGSIKVCAHYDVIKKGTKTLLVFHDLPYGVDIDGGVKAPLKKLVIEEGYESFEDIEVQKVGNRNFDITVTLSKNADVAKCLEILFSKTSLADTIKINQTLIVNGEPRLLNLKQLIEYWVNYRSNIIKKVAINDYGKTDHKLTVTIGLQKCMSDIDKLITLIRNANDRAAAKRAIMAEFSLNDEQGDAVLDMKLSRLSKLDLTELNDDEKKLEETLAQLKQLIENEQLRYDVIIKDLDEIKKVIGNDERLTEVIYRRPVENIHTDQPLVKQEWLVYPTGLGAARLGINGSAIDDNLVDVVFAYSPDDIWCYNAEGDMSPITAPCTGIIRAFNREKGQKLISITANGNIKVTDCSEYKWKKTEKVMKLKDDDKLVFTGVATDNDYVIIFNGERVLKLLVKDLPIASKLTVGVKSGFTNVVSADIVSAGDALLMVTKDNKGKLTPVIDFSDDSRGNKGQTIAEDTVICKMFAQGRENFYVIPKVGKPFTVASDKVSIKSRTAIGASISTRTISNII